MQLADMPTIAPSTSEVTADDRRIAGTGTDEASWRRWLAEQPLRRLGIATWVDRFRCVWIVAPHPDDEILALGGTLARLSMFGVDLRVVSVTDGTASHRGSSAWSEARLARIRPRELAQALDVLGIEATVHRAGFPDGDVERHRGALELYLAARVQPDDLVLATWRLDGHPDHEACGKASAATAARTGAVFAEYPVWMWHWARPAERAVPWHRARTIELDADQVARKARAVRCFASQLEADGPREAILPPHVVARFARPFETVFAG